MRSSSLHGRAGWHVRGTNVSCIFMLRCSFLTMGIAISADFPALTQKSPKTFFRFLTISSSRLLAPGDKPKPSNFFTQGLRRPVTVQVPVYTSSRGGIHKIRVGRICGIEFLHELSVLPQPVLLVIRLGPIECCGRKYLCCDCAVPSCRFTISRLQSQSFLLLIVIKNCGLVLLRP